MVVITAQKCREANIDVFTIQNSDLFWMKMIDVQRGLGLKNISSLVIRKIKGIFNTKKPTLNQIKQYKMSLANLMNNHSKFINQMYVLILWKKNKKL